MFEQKRSPSLMRGVFGVCGSDKDAPVPDWALEGNLFCVARTPDELSLVCEQSGDPGGLGPEHGWRCLKVESPFEFDLTGAFSPVAAPLAEADIGMFVVATRGSDYQMVKEPDPGRAVAVLSRDGYRVEGQQSRSPATDRSGSGATQVYPRYPR